MARAETTLSTHTNYLANIVRPTKLLNASLLQAPTFSFPNKLLHLTHHAATCRSPTIVICCGKLDGSSEEEENEDENPQGFVYDNDMMRMMMEEEEEEDSDGDDTESSVDLLIRFLQSMLKKLSRTTKKACRSILPTVISPQLVSFAVDGILLLAALSIVKALLEVVCTLGGTVFVVVLILRVIWAAIAYFQSPRNTFNQAGSSIGSTRPIA